MRNSIYFSLLLAALLSAGCSKQNELEQANARIAQLESELMAERAKVSSAESKSPGANSAASNSSAQKAEASSPSGDQWVYQAREDKMTGKAVYTATVLSSNTVQFGSPYDGEQHGNLTLRIDPKYGKDVIFSIERGLILCHSYGDCQVLVRFDEGKPESFSGSGPADNSSETVFIRNYDKFVAKLRNAKIVRISTNIYQEGAPVFEFDVSGFNQKKYVPGN